jgi:hypothetical protein
MKNASFSKLCVMGLAALSCAAPSLAHGWVPPPEPPRPTNLAPTVAGSAVRQSEGVQQPVRVGAVTAAKPKGGSTPWIARIRVPWTVAFLPAIPVGDGYGARPGTIHDAIRLPAARGGWVRDGKPVIVFQYDATSADHRRLLASLDADPRVRVASHFFNCFRVDVGAFAEKGAARDAKLSVFLADGTLVGELVGQRKLSAVYELVETAWKKQHNAELANRVAKLDGILNNKAAAEHFIPLCEAGIVCPDCGHERRDMVERVAELKARSEACDRAIDDLRTVARN